MFPRRFPGEERPKTESRIHLKDCRIVLETMGTRCIPATISKREVELRSKKCGRRQRSCSTRWNRSEWKVDRRKSDQRFSDNDAKVRNVKVRTASGEYSRPVQKMA